MAERIDTSKLRKTKNEREKRRELQRLRKQIEGADKKKHHHQIFSDEPDGANVDINNNAFSRNTDTGKWSQRSINNNAWEPLSTSVGPGADVQSLFIVANIDDLIAIDPNTIPEASKGYTQDSALYYNRTNNNNPGNDFWQLQGGQVVGDQTDLPSLSYTSHQNVICSVTGDDLGALANGPYFGMGTVRGAEWVRIPALWLTETPLGANGDFWINMASGLPVAEVFLNNAPFIGFFPYTHLE